MATETTQTAAPAPIRLLTEFRNVAICLNQLTANHFLSLNNRLYFTFLHAGYGEELFYYT